jgi:hypothetical protein
LVRPAENRSLLINPPQVAQGQKPAGLASQAKPVEDPAKKVRIESFWTSNALSLCCEHTS